MKKIYRCKVFGVSVVDDLHHFEFTRPWIGANFDGKFSP
jgi:hypothetical protein